MRFKKLNPSRLSRPKSGPFFTIHGLLFEDHITTQKIITIKTGGFRVNIFLTHDMARPLLYYILKLIKLLIFHLFPPF